jgi:protein SCO1/2
MIDRLRRQLLGGVALLPFAASVFGRPESQPAPPHTFAPPDSGREVMHKRFFPDLPLVTHEGKKVRFYSDLLKDKIVVLNLMYADCTTLCPMITANLLAAQKILEQRVKQDIFFYSLTIKPVEDTPEKLRQYATTHQVRGNWLFLTGQPENLEQLRLRLGYADPNPLKDRNNKALHSGMVRYGNEPLSQWSSIQGSADPEWIAEEITYVVPATKVRPAQKGPA